LTSLLDALPFSKPQACEQRTASIYRPRRQMRIRQSLLPLYGATTLMPDVSTGERTLVGTGTATTRSLVETTAGFEPGDCAAVFFLDCRATALLVLSRFCFADDFWIAECNRSAANILFLYRMTMSHRDLLQAVTDCSALRVSVIGVALTED
jgi:hypothetical protein